MNAPQRIVKTKAPSTFNGKVILLMLFSSISTAIVCYFILPRFPVAPSTAVTSTQIIRPFSPAKAKAVTVKPSGVTIASPGADASETLNDATEAASSVVDAITSIRTVAGPSFVGPKAHTWFNNDLNALQSAASQLLEVSTAGGDASQATNSIGAFTTALDTAIARAVEISKRSGETRDAQQIAGQIAASLGDIRSSLP